MTTNDIKIIHVSQARKKWALNPEMVDLLKSLPWLFNPTEKTNQDLIMFSYIQSSRRPMSQ